MPKHFLLCGLLLLCGIFPATVQAQLTKGTRYWGGTIRSQGGLGFETLERGNGESRNYDFNIQPEVQFGRFRSATTLVGLGTRYGFAPEGREELTRNSSSRYVSQSVALLPFVRKYLSLSDRWSLFLHTELGVGYQWDAWNSSGPGYSNSRVDRYWQHELGVKPGVVYYFPKKGWAIEGYANVLSLQAMYKPKSPDQQRLYVSTNLGTAVPTYLTLRLSRYSTPTSN
jgi:hypothetical protein